MGQPSVELECESLEKREDDFAKLPIRPWELPANGVIRRDVRSILNQEVVPQQEIGIPEAITAYLDVLGFSHKKSAKDMEDTLRDFAGPLIVTAYAFRNIRFTIFSDCAFVTTSVIMRSNCFPRFALFLLNGHLTVFLSEVEWH